MRQQHTPNALVNKAKAVYAYLHGKTDIFCVNISKKEARLLLKTSGQNFTLTVEEDYLYIGATQ